jgi:hypothetical protein
MSILNVDGNATQAIIDRSLRHASDGSLNLTDLSRCAIG